MERKFNNFITQFKHGQIESNKASLIAQSEIIEILIGKIDSDDYITTNSLDKCEGSILKSIEDLNDLNIEELISDYIKFGIHYDNIISDIIEYNEYENIKGVVRSYLNIAKLMKDSRINDIAISMSEKLSNLE